MFIPAHFRHDNVADVIAFIKAFPFATLIVNGSAGPIVTFAPLVLVLKDGNPDVLVGHISKQNSLFSDDDLSVDAAAVYNGDNAYVSPSAYATKIEHGRAVPTWNYTAIKIDGALKFDRDSRNTGRYLEMLTSQMECDREKPWSISDAPEDYIRKLSTAIIGFEIKVSSLHFIRKLSQNKSQKDRDGVISMLSSSERVSERMMAQEMMKI